jgi:hypothetical protein
VSQASPVLQLRLSLSSSSGSDSAEQNDSARSTAAARKGVRWDEEAVDNEGLGKKSSKKCCIFHKQRKFDDPYEDDDADDAKDKLRKGVKKMKEEEKGEIKAGLGDGSVKNDGESLLEANPHSCCNEHDHDHKHSQTRNSTEAAEPLVDTKESGSECTGNSSSNPSSSFAAIKGCLHCDRIKAIEEEAKRRQESVLK